MELGTPAIGWPQYMVTPGRDKVIKVGKKFFRVVEG
jgi:hypothetical protein